MFSNLKIGVFIFGLFYLSGVLCENSLPATIKIGMSIFGFLSHTKNINIHHVGVDYPF